MSELSELNAKLQTLRVAEEQFFAEAFTNPVTREPYKLPEVLRGAATRICRSYGIRGTCDPMYIANVIAVELGIGDGFSNFKEDGSMTPEQELAALRLDYEDIKRRWGLALQTPRKEDLDKIKILRKACDLAVLNFQRSRPDDLYDDDHEAWAALQKALEETK